MTKVSAISKDLYLLILSSLGIFATWFAMMSTSSCSLFSAYQPQMPNSLIKRDE